MHNCLWRIVTASLLALLSGCGGSGDDGGLEISSDVMEVRAERLVVVTSPFALIQVRDLLDGVTGVQIRRLNAGGQSGHFNEISYDLIRAIRASNVVVLTGGAYDRTVSQVLQKLGPGLTTKGILIFPPGNNSATNTISTLHPWMDPDAVLQSIPTLAQALRFIFTDDAGRISKNAETMQLSLSRAIEDVRKQSSDWIRQHPQPISALNVHASTTYLVKWYGFQSARLPSLAEGAPLTLAISGKLSELFRTHAIQVVVWDDIQHLPWLDSMAQNHSVPQVLFHTLEKMIRAAIATRISS
ncbi:MAG: zinc ABC transporter substrate-binding protein [Verrucomicrobia bacterium]|nr:zinc ABC transporter substrate-binding protein [Verrucomicrobiota bacterium]